MSAWPEAVWIVRQLANQLSFENLANDYSEKLNTVNSNLNELISSTLVYIQKEAPSSAPVGDYTIWFELNQQPEEEVEENE